VVLGALVAALAGCGGGGDAAQFRNPVHDADFPDPFVLRVGETYHAYATNGPRGNVQTLTSEDLVHWTPGADALPEVGRWAYEGKTWAPEVLARDDGTYVLYYTANAADFGKQCIGAAVASEPGGPFADRADRPLVCQDDEGGSIDPSPFRDDDGGLYLLWKNDGNCCRLDTWIYVQPLAPDGLRLTGAPVRLVRQDAGWEADVVEAPTLWREDGRFVLFYSGNAFESDFYAVGHAMCEGPLGPCADSERNPILATACRAAGPGHQALVRVGGETWILYHAWQPGTREKRVVWLDRVEWEDGRPSVAGPTCGEQQAP
jgi:beta-xylosidase